MVEGLLLSVPLSLIRCCVAGELAGRSVVLAGSLIVRGSSVLVAGVFILPFTGSLVSRVLMTSPELAERSGSETRALVLSTSGEVLRTGLFVTFTGDSLPIERTLVLGARALPFVLGP